MLKIIITGATGFTGSHILDSFDKEEHVIASCRQREKLPLIYRDKAFIGDLSSYDYVEHLTKEADIICHTASWAEMNGSVKDSKKKFLDITLQLIDKAVKNGVKRFIFLSAITSKPIVDNRLHSKLPLAKLWAHYDSVIRIENYLEKVSDKIEVVILRVGLFIGKNYSIGLLPILLPRLKTHLVPYINKGETSLPLIDGEDIALAFKLSSIAKFEDNFTIIDIVGKEIPTVKEFFSYLNEKYSYPLPHFSVSFSLGYVFARFIRFIHKVIPFEPLIVPSIILLLEETYANNEKAKKLLGYSPKVDWRESIDIQIAEMNIRQVENMKMNK